jgi:peptidoglycan/xylan/chitin deacetylase (PgdA/CDA1 family)
MPPPPRNITSVRDHLGKQTPRERARALAREGAIFALSSLSFGPPRSSFLRFPYYHHVFDDERRDFAAQLRTLKNWGDFLSLDDAVAALESPAPISGRYYCITFDDGFRNCLTNAAPILVEQGAPAAFFVPTRYIGTTIERDAELLATFDGGAAYVDYLDWDECRRLVAAGMTIGSHTVSHAHLKDLSDAEVTRELTESKATIERELGIPCPHFCCPWGRPGLDYTPGREPEMARKAGYRSFLTTRRGSNREKPSPFDLSRDHLLAGWPRYEVRYFLSR